VAFCNWLPCRAALEVSAPDVAIIETVDAFMRRVAQSVGRIAMGRMVTTSLCQAINLGDQLAI